MVQCLSHGTIWKGGIAQISVEAFPITFTEVNNLKLNFYTTQSGSSIEFSGSSITLSGNVATVVIQPDQLATLEDGAVRYISEFNGIVKEYGTRLFLKSPNPYTPINFQEKLTAGSGITIENNIISCNFSGGTGPQGPQGARGEKGEKGDTGEAGAQGPQGATGAQGAQGAQGEKGETGAQGAQGEKGDKGETGEAGAQGPQGATGAQGEKGDKGDTGEAGAQGAQGPQGATGAQGAQGERGEKGDTGETGAQGPQGATGAQGPAGTYTAGTGISIENDVISCTITGGSGNVIELTQAEYNALTGYAEDTIYVITDAPAVDLTQYYTSAQTYTKTEVDTAVGAKADKVNISPNTNSFRFPYWNEQGIITGTNVFVFQNKNTAINGTGCYYAGWSNTIPSIYAPTAVGTQYQILQSNGSGAPVWSSIKMQFLTQTQYDALATKDSTTIYFIIGE